MRWVLMSTDLKKVISDWQKVRFDEIATVVTDRIDKPIESGLKDYIGLEHLDTECIRIKRFGSTEDVDATKFLCKKGDIIFGKRNSYLRKVAVSDRDAVVSAHSMVLRPTGEKIYPDFLPCFMQSSIFWKAAHSISEGSMSPTIKWKTLAAQEFWLPGIEEQKKISELLWSIEDNIQKTEKLIETTEILKQGLLNELLTKGIGHTRFKDSELGRIPEEWEVVKFSDCMLINTESLSEKTPSDYEIEYIDISSIEITGTIGSTTKHKFLEAPSRARRIIRKNDVIISTVRPYLKAFAIIKSDLENQICSTGFAVLRANQEVSFEYIYQFVLSDLFMQQVNTLMVGSNYPALNQRDIKNFKIPLPSLSEQKNILTFLNSFDKLLDELSVHLERSKSLKKKLTNKLLSGN